MLDFFDSITEAATFTPTSRLSLPFLVDGYVTDSLNVADHHILVRRADPDGDGVTPLKLFLDPNDPTANQSDAAKRRPSISAFEFRQYAKALRDQDMQAAIALGKDNRAKTFTEVGGMILGEGLAETEGGFTARWIRALRQSSADQSHRVLIGYGTVRPRAQRTAMDVEVLAPDQAVMTTNGAELREALLHWFTHAPDLGTRAIYLRLLRTGQDGTVQAAIAGSAAGTGRIDVRDTKVGDRYIRRTPLESVDYVLATPVGQQLMANDWGTVTVEVIPATVVQYGSKSLEKRGDPDAPYTMPGDSPGTGSSTDPHRGFTVSTVRLTGVKNADNQIDGFLAGLVAPITGGLIRLVDVPTTNYAPEVEPVLPVFASRKTPAATDPATPLGENFTL